MSNYKHYGSPTAFLDMLFNITFGFVILFVLFLLILKVDDGKPSFQPKAEYIVLLEWDGELDDDVDLWLVGPSESQPVFFRVRERGNVFLDKDDLGHINDQVRKPDGTSEIIKINREIGTIRGIVPGKYKINIHFYTKRSKSEITKTTVTVFKINPYKQILVKEFELKLAGEERTVGQIIVNEKGEVEQVLQDPDDYIGKYMAGMWGDHP